MSISARRWEIAKAMPLVRGDFPQSSRVGLRPRPTNWASPAVPVAGQLKSSLSLCPGKIGVDSYVDLILVWYIDK